MGAEQALAEAVAYLQGLGDAITPDQGATMISEQLAARGYSVQSISAPVLYDLTPSTLRRVRTELAVSLTQVANEARLGLRAVSNAESCKTKPRVATLTAIAEALVRLGARWLR